MLDKRMLYIFNIKISVIYKFY